MTDHTALRVSTSGDRELVMTRAFDAPRNLVFAALTQPELLRRWYGPDNWTLTVCNIDFRVGGKWRYVSRQPDGREVGQHGFYREIIDDERIVHTEEWEDWNPGEVLATLTLVEQDGRTTLTTTTSFPSKNVRDMLLEAGMISGAEESYAKLDALLQSDGVSSR